MFLIVHIFAPLIAQLCYNTIQYSLEKNVSLLYNKYTKKSITEAENMFKIGIMTDSLRIDTKSAIKKAAEIGAAGFQMYATKGENSPENLTPAKRKELLDFTKSHGLVFSAICGDMGGGFVDKERNPLLIERSKRIIELAKDLECDIVTTHIGKIPNDRNDARYGIMQEACFELSRFADSINSSFAVETGPEPAIVLKEFLDSLSSKGIAVNLDPANLVMVVGDDPVEAVHTLKDYIVHTHAKDGRMLKNNAEEEIYGKVIDHATIANTPAFEELPLGEGDVNFPTYLQALKDVGYNGFLTIERECGDNPIADITKAVDFLKKLI